MGSPISETLARAAGLAWQAFQAVNQRIPERRSRNHIAQTSDTEATETRAEATEGSGLLRGLEIILCDICDCSVFRARNP